jgi:hypothetical protein
MSETGKVQLNAHRSSSGGNGWVCNHSSERWFRRQPAFWAEGASLPKIGPRLCTGPSKQRPPRLPHLAIATGPTRATWYPHSPKNLINCGMGGAAAILRINSRLVGSTSGVTISSLFGPISTSWRMTSNRRPHRLKPRRGESDCHMVLLTSALDPTMLK